MGFDGKWVFYVKIDISMVVEASTNFRLAENFQVKTERKVKYGE